MEELLIPVGIAAANCLPLPEAISFLIGICVRSAPCGWSIPGEGPNQPLGRAPALYPLIKHLIGNLNMAGRDASFFKGLRPTLKAEYNSAKLYEMDRRNIQLRGRRQDGEGPDDSPSLSYTGLLSLHLGSHHSDDVLARWYSEPLVIKMRRPRPPRSLSRCLNQFVRGRERDGPQLTEVDVEKLFPPRTTLSSVTECYTVLQDHLQSEEETRK